ncbi:hypothetical protein ACFQ0M_09745 [Kitasatospora aburaviensis]
MLADVVEVEPGAGDVPDGRPDVACQGVRAGPADLGHRTGPVPAGRGTADLHGVAEGGGRVAVEPGEGAHVAERRDLGGRIVGQFGPGECAVEAGHRGGVAPVLHPQAAGGVRVLGGEPGERAAGAGGAGAGEPAEDGPQGLLDGGGAGHGGRLAGAQPGGEQAGQGVGGVGVQGRGGVGVGGAEHGVQGDGVGGCGDGAAVGAVQRAEQAVVGEAAGRVDDERRRYERWCGSRPGAGAGGAGQRWAGPVGRCGGRLPVPLLGPAAGGAQVAVGGEQVVEAGREPRGGPAGAVLQLADGGVVVARSRRAAPG